jgi:hypothetical protein
MQTAGYGIIFPGINAEPRYGAIKADGVMGDDFWQHNNKKLQIPRSIRQLADQTNSKKQIQNYNLITT